MACGRSNGNFTDDVTSLEYVTPKSQRRELKTLKTQYL